MIVEYRKVRCDECGKEETVAGAANFPSGWLTLGITEWSGSSGHEFLSKDICSRRCALRLMKKIKTIPKVRYRI